MSPGVELPALCGTRNCKAEAEFRVYWPNQTIDLCAACNARAHRLADAMGFALASEPLPATPAAAPQGR